MTTVAILDRPSIEVVPGDEALSLLEIRNNGSIVESYRVEVLGEAAAWTTVTPAVVSVYPGTSAQVSLAFRPPRQARLAAGEVPYAVRVQAAERPDDTVVPEGVVHLLPFTETLAEITPRTSRGRWGGRHEVAVDNRGNSPLRVVVGAVDQDARLRIAVRPERVTIGPGEAAFVAVRVRPRRLMWRGSPATLPFQVLVTPAAAAPAADPVFDDPDVVPDVADPAVTVDAAHVQAPIVPQGIGRIVAAVVVLALVLGGLWYGLLRHTVRSAAREAAQQDLASVQQKADTAAETARKALDAVGGATPTPTPAPSQGTPGSGPTATAAPLPGVPAGATSSVRRLRVTTAGGVTGSDQYTAPARQTYVITDVIFQNPQGDEGSLELLVDGQPMFVQMLNNFRDLDYHLVSPIEVPAGRTVRLRVVCQRPGTTLAGSGGGGQCRNFALITGYLRAVPRATAAP